MVKSILILLVCFLGLPVLAGDKYDEALEAVKKEPKVKSAAWNSKTIQSLLVGVYDDGSNRDGYAKYFCLKLRDFDIRGGVVRVMDEGAAHRGEWKELGKAWCPK